MRSRLIIGGITTIAIVAFLFFTIQEKHLPLNEGNEISPLSENVSSMSSELNPSFNKALSIDSKSITIPFLEVDDTVCPEIATLAKDRGSPRIDANFANKVQTIQSPKEWAIVIQVARDHMDRDTERHEALNLLRRSSYQEIDNLLWEILTNPIEKERFRSFAAQHLGQSFELTQGSNNINLRNKLRGLLADKHEAVRREALLALLVEADSEAITVVKIGLSDISWQKSRDLIIRAMDELDWRDQVSQLRPLAYDSDESVRIAAINVLGKWGDEDSRSAFEEAKGSAKTRLQRAGNLALLRLAEYEQKHDSNVGSTPKAGF